MLQRALLAITISSAALHPLHAAPADNEHFAHLIAQVSKHNATLWQYFFPNGGKQSDDVALNWRTHSSGCSYSHDCWCGHVNGSRHRATNPHPTACEGGVTAPKMKLASFVAACPPSKLVRKCSCYTGMGKPCLYSDMNPGTTLATIALMRDLGVDHIIEEGREGGLSAFLYYLHGFRVSSVEFLPEYEPLQALQQLAPAMALLHGDGAKIIPNLVESMTPEQAACTAIFYDGEKRIPAHKSFLKVRDKVAFAAFDDSNYPEFRTYLNQQNETWWETGTHPELFEAVTEAVARIGASNVQGGTAVGGIRAAAQTATTFVVGGAWGACKKRRHHDAALARGA